MRRKSPFRPSPPAPALSTYLRKARIGVIRGDYHAKITRSLEEKCLLGLEEGGIKRQQIDCYAVPGCFEIPLLAQALAATRRYDALIALGAVIRGETLHFELVARECARGIMDVALKYQVPVIFEVLAAERLRDALERAGNNRLNKGFEAAHAALAMLRALREIKQ